MTVKKIYKLQTVVQHTAVRPTHSVRLPLVVGRRNPCFKM